MRYSQYKASHIGIKLESLEVDKWYSINLSPSLDDYDSVSSFKRGMKTRFTNYSDKGTIFKYLLYIEIGPTGRLHLHGMINILPNNRVNFLLRFFNKAKRDFTIVMKEIEDLEGWKKYMTKQSEIIKEETNKEPFITELDIDDSLRNILRTPKETPKPKDIEHFFIREPDTGESVGN